MDIPHLALPFNFARPQAATTEQDSIDEITGCVLAILLCPLGFRVELPEFGIPDPTFQTRVDLDEIEEAIETWEPRAASVLDQYPDLLDEMIRHVNVAVQLRTEG